jgi:hypothetical protein
MIQYEPVPCKGVLFSPMRVGEKTLCIKYQMDICHVPRHEVLSAAACSLYLSSANDRVRDYLGCMEALQHNLKRFNSRNAVPAISLDWSLDYT